MTLCGHGETWMTSRNSSTLEVLLNPMTLCGEPYRQAVFRFIELHANSEYMGGLTERDWIPKAPGLHRS